ncbi:MAG: DUF2726 domain-containing protein [Pseudomonadales bacterium]
MEWLVIPAAGSVAVALAVAVGLLARRPHKPKADHGRYPYRVQLSVFSTAERTFFGVLARAVGDTYEVLGKVRVAEVIAPREDLTQAAWRDAFDRTSRVHFDFVLCHKDNLQPAAVVELESRDHRTRSRGESRFIDRATHAAHLTVIRFEEKGSYSVNAVRGKVMRALDAPVMAHTERIEPAT